MLIHIYFGIITTWRWEPFFFWAVAFDKLNYTKETEPGWIVVLWKHEMKIIFFIKFKERKLIT